jgi:hypothetical protein
MKLLKMFVLTLGLSSVGSFAQDMVVEDLPVATISDVYYVTLPDAPVEEYYYIDISHLDFEDEQEAIYLLGAYVTGNLITNEVFYSENYMIIQIHFEYVDGAISLADLQSYLGILSKPPTE